MERNVQLRHGETRCRNRRVPPRVQLRATGGYNTEMKDIEPALAKALGFPKPEYTAVERERRWLCSEFPRDLIRQTLTVKDVYIDGTRMRLREMRPRDETPPLFKLSRKADVDARTRLITTIYLPEPEFALLAAMLKGLRIVKTRHRLHAPYRSADDERRRIRV